MPLSGSQAGYPPSRTASDDVYISINGPSPLVQADDDDNYNVNEPFGSLGLFQTEDRADTALGHYLPAQHTISTGLLEMPAARGQYLVPPLARDTGPAPAFRYDPLTAPPLLLPISGPSRISSVDLLSYNLQNYDQIAPLASSSVPNNPFPQSPTSGGHLLQSPSMLSESVHSGPGCTNEDFWPSAWGYPVPQRPYEQRGRDRNVTLKDPILFRTNGVLGISLQDALERKHSGLDERDTEMVIGCRSSVSVRISWCGYKPWVEQIKTHDGRKIPRRDTKEKLATKVARLVKRFMEENRDAAFAGTDDPSWCLKSDHITLDNLYLVGLIHRSKSSWQPFLVLRPRFSAYVTSIF